MPAQMIQNIMFCYVIPRSWMGSVYTCDKSLHNIFACFMLHINELLNSLKKEDKNHRGAYYE